MIIYIFNILEINQYFLVVVEATTSNPLSW